MASNKKSSRQLANREIRFPYVRLIVADGAQFGIIPTKEAREKATNSNLDLVCVSPNADPPVCKIIDLGKLKYEQKKKYKENVKKSRETRVLLKEMVFKPQIEEHDFNIKLNKIQKFLDAGNKVKITVRFRGRELSFKDQGFALVERVTERVQAEWDQKPSFLGRHLIGILKPSDISPR